MRKKVTESEIDASLAELVYLRDARSDTLGKILARAIRLLKQYRQDRIYYRRLAAAYRVMENAIEEAKKEKPDA